MEVDMVRLGFAGFAVLFLVSCAAPVSMTPPAGLVGEVSAPTLNVGNAWRYAVRDGFTRIARGEVEYRVQSVVGDAVTVEVLTDGHASTEIYARDGNWLRRPATNLQEFGYSPAYRALDFPLSPGKTWKARVTATDPTNGRSFPVFIEGRVLGWEKVGVPAGEFDTLKVHRMVYLDYFEQGVRGQSVIQETDWYAPAIGQIARRETTSRYLRLADAGVDSPFRLVNVRANRSSDRMVRARNSRGDGSVVPRYEQDDWLVYELTRHSRN
jgi:hypothetical protein